MYMNRYIKCYKCGYPIYYADDLHEQDDCYEIENGKCLCENCVDKYVRDKYFKKLEG